MNTIFQYSRLLLAALLLGVLATACDADLLKFSDENKGAYKPSEGEPIAMTLDADANFSEWVKVLSYSEFYSTLNQGSAGVVFTEFAPNNAAMQAFYQKMEVSGIEDLGLDYAKALVKYHTYSGDSLKLSEKFTGDVIGLIYSNVSGDKLTIRLDSLVNGFRVNEEAHMSSSYTVATNGFIYELNGVLTPLVETVYDRVAGNDAYRIMAAALEATGYDKELATLADTVTTLGVQNITKRNYTYFTVSDANFAKAGINTLEDLKQALSARYQSSESNDPTVTADSLLKQYVEYHMMDANYKLADLTAMLGTDTLRIWASCAPNQIFTMTQHILSITEVVIPAEVEGGEPTIVSDTLFAYYLNQADIPASFVESGCDVLAKNGYVQELDSWFPVYTPTQSTVVWDLADYADVRSACGLLYRPEAVVTNETPISLTKCTSYTFEYGPDGYASGGSYYGISYVACSKNWADCLYKDRVVFNLGYQGSCVMKTPTLVRGKYKVTLSFAYMIGHSDMRTMKGCKGGAIKISFDEDHVKTVAPYTTVPKNSAGVYDATLYDEIEFEETASHVFKFIVMDPAASTNKNVNLQFDCITFTPITE